MMDVLPIIYMHAESKRILKKPNDPEDGTLETFETHAPCTSGKGWSVINFYIMCIEFT